MSRGAHVPEAPATATPAPAAAPWDPLGRMLLESVEGAGSGAVEVIMEDGRVGQMSLGDLLREEGFPPAEETALELARGRVLDAGAGAGAHTLELESQGLRVTALEISPLAVEAMHRRGVLDARRGDLFDPGCLAGERFDTVLSMMNGAGLAGDLAGLPRLLEAMGRLLAPGGVLLMDSSDVRRSDDPFEPQRIRARRQAGRYFGEARFRMRYRGVTGPVFPWLFVDPKTLLAHARRCGWQAQIIFQGGDGAYLARLTPP